MMTGTAGSEHRNEREEQAAGARVNVGTAERAISAVAGGALAVYGVRQRSLPGVLLAGIGAALIDRGLRGHCMVYQAMNIDTAHREPARPEEFFRRGIHVQEAVTINKPPEELYRFWRKLENLPRIMQHLEEVIVRDPTHSHWRATAPAGMHVEWDAEIINDEPNQTIAWRSLADAAVQNAGSVRFVPAPGDRGTEVHVTLDYLPPAGRIGSWFAKLFGEEPSQQVYDDLRRFKQVMEAGEVPTIEGQPAGAGRARDKAVAGMKPVEMQNA